MSNSVVNLSVDLQIFDLLFFLILRLYSERTRVLKRIEWKDILITRSMIHLIFAFFVFLILFPLLHFDFEGGVSGSGGWNAICFYFFICVTAEVYLKQTRPTVFVIVPPPRGRTVYL